MHVDLYSDLHDNWWSKDKLLNYRGLGTSLVAVVAGDISNDWDYTYATLVEMARCYRHVIFVDGNHEHNHQMDIEANCAAFQALCLMILHLLAVMVGGHLIFVIQNIAPQIVGTI